MQFGKWSSRPLPEIETKGTGIHGLGISQHGPYPLESTVRTNRPLIPSLSKRGRHEAPKRIDDFMCGLELRQIRKPRDDSIIETYRMGKISVNRDNVFNTGNYL